MEPKYGVYVFILLLTSMVIVWGIDSGVKLLTPLSNGVVRKMEQVNWKTGDLLLWSYSLSVRTDIEKLLCGSQYTHSSIVFVDRSGVPWVWDTVAKTGNRVHRLSEALKTPKYRCFYRPLNVGLNPVRFERLIKLSLDGAYSYRFWKGVLYKWAPYLTLPVAKSDAFTASRFCSELTAFTYEKMGVMDFAHCPSLRRHGHMMPGDFSEVSEQDHPLPFVNNYSFGLEIQIENKEK